MDHLKEVLKRGMLGILIGVSIFIYMIVWFFIQDILEGAGYFFEDILSLKK